MVEALFVLLGISIILFLGFFAEFLFKKIHVPDVLFLLLIGFLLGPYAFNVVNPGDIKDIAPIFTTFALLFLLYDGAFNISLKSLLTGAMKSLYITLVNFFISTIIISGIMFLFGYELLISILTGCILGGISSAFVIPLLKQLNVKGETYSVLMLESAITDVLCIVSAFAVMEIIKASTFNFQIVISKIASLFAIAGLIGILAGVIWVFLTIKVFKEHKSYMITIAYLILVYGITEFLHGNGAIAALFFGLVLKNSKELTEIFGNIMHGPEKQTKKGESSYGVNVTTQSEEFFYSQISFFLKTFFFVYIGLLFNVADVRLIIIGAIVAVAIMISRNLSRFTFKKFSLYDQTLIASTFARGLAAAAIAQVVIMYGIPRGAEIVNITYSVIIFTIFLSSIKIFMLKKNAPSPEKAS